MKKQFLTEKKVLGVISEGVLNGKIPLNDALDFLSKYGMKLSGKKSSPEDVPLYLRPQFEIQKFIATVLVRHRQPEEIIIISGLKENAPLINSPHDLDPILFNLAEDDTETINRRLYRIREHSRTRLGFRDAFLCMHQWKDIHPAWYFRIVLFANAIFDIGDNRHILGLQPGDSGCTPVDIDCGRIDAHDKGYACLLNNREANIHLIK